MREKGLDFGRPHVLRMPLIVKKNKAAYPVEVALLGADGVVQAAQTVTELVEQTWCARDVVTGAGRFGGF